MRAEPERTPHPPTPSTATGPAGPNWPPLHGATSRSGCSPRPTPARSGGDALELLRVTAAICATDGAILRALILARRTSPELAHLVHQHVLPIGRLGSVAAVVPAAARGENPAEAGDLFHDLAPALVMSRLPAHGLSAEKEFLARPVDPVLIPVLRCRPD